MKDGKLKENETTFLIKITNCNIDKVYMFTIVSKLIQNNINM